MFKEGDKVICVNNKNKTNLIIGEVYTVSKFFPEDVKNEHDRVILSNDDKKTYFAHRFVKETISKFHVGQKIVVIDNSGTKYLKNGEVCTVSKTSIKIDKFEEFEDMVSLHEKTNKYYAERFISLSEYRKIKLNSICQNLE